MKNVNKIVEKNNVCMSLAKYNSNFVIKYNNKSKNTRNCPI